MSTPTTTPETREAHPLRTGPGQLLVPVSLLGNAGHGPYTAGSALYFAREVGLSPTTAGTGQS